MAHAATMEASASALQPPDPRWEPLLGLSCELSVQLPVSHLTVAGFLDLRVKRIVRLEWPVSADVPVWVNGVQIAWGEFEVLEKSLAVRLTEML